MKQDVRWKVGIFLLCLGLGSAFGRPDKAAAETAALKAGIPEGLPGFYARVDGTLLVSDPIQKRITACLEGKLHRRIVWTAVPTARLLAMLVANDLDLAYPMQFRSERSAVMLPSEYTWRAEIYQLSRKKIDMTDKNIRVGVRLNSPEYSDMREAGYRNIASPADYEGLSRMLSADLIDVAVVPNTAYQELSGGWVKNLTVTVRNGRGVGFYVNQSDPHKLLEGLNKVVKSCRDK